MQPSSRPITSRGDAPMKCGVKVIHRTDSNYHDTVQAVASSLVRLYQMDKKTASKVSQGAKQTSKAASWENFIKYYDEAYDQALSARDAREKKVNG